jgi:hypothetical protein
MKANYVNLCSPEQTTQDSNYVDESPARLQDIMIYTIEDGTQINDIYALGFSDGSIRLRCFDVYDVSFNANKKEKWVCRLINEEKNESK